MATLKSILSQSRCSLEPKSFIRGLCPLKPLLRISKHPQPKIIQPSKNLWAGNKSPALFLINHFAQMIYRPHTKYSLTDLYYNLKFSNLTVWWVGKYCVGQQMIVPTHKYVTQSYNISHIYLVHSSLIKWHTFSNSRSLYLLQEKTCQFSKKETIWYLLNTFAT